MRPKERRDSGQNDLFRARLDQIVDLGHPLAKLSRAIDWRFLEERFGAVYSDKVGHPPLPTRLMAGLSLLKHMHDLSDEDLCARCAGKTKRSIPSSGGSCRVRRSCNGLRRVAGHLVRSTPIRSEAPINGQYWKVEGNYRTERELTSPSVARLPEFC